MKPLAITITPGGRRVHYAISETGAHCQEETVCAVAVGRHGSSGG